MRRLITAMMILAGLVAAGQTTQVDTKRLNVRETFVFSGDTITSIVKQVVMNEAMDSLFILYADGTADTAIVTVSDSSYFSRDAGNGEVYPKTLTDQIGIGTANPAEMLDVVGNINIPATTSTVGQIKQGSNRVFHTYGTGNTWLGAGSGNFTLSGTYNVALGNAVLDHLTTGSYNTGIGATALTANTTGYDNTGIGGLSMLANTEGYSNTAVGMSAMADNTTGSNNVGIGQGALQRNITGGSNVAVGQESMFYTTGSSCSTGLGTNTLRSATSGYDNVAIGSSAMFLDTSGCRNTAVGTEALYTLKNGNYNVAVGDSAGALLTTGSYNTILGARAGNLSTTASRQIWIGYSTGTYAAAATVDDIGGIDNSNTDKPLVFFDFADDSTYVNGKLHVTQNVGFPATISADTGTIKQGGVRFMHTYGTRNIFMGYNSGNYTLTGFDDCAVGYESGEFITSGDNLTFLGNYAGYSNTTGNANTAVGSYSLLFNTTGTGNVAIGSAALDSVTGGNNVAIGYKAGTRNQTGSGNIFLGYQAGYSETGSNKLYIENSSSATPLIYGDFAEDYVKINDSLNVQGNLVVENDIIGNSLLQVQQIYSTIDTLFIDSIATFESDIVYKDTFWDDLTFGATSYERGSKSSPDFDADSIALRWPNNDTTESALYYNFQMPHRWKAGTQIYPHVHYIQHTEGDTAEFWIIRYRWTDMNEVQSGTWTRIQSTNETVFSYSAGVHQLASFPAISGSGHTESSILDIVLLCYHTYEDGTGRIYMKDFDIHFEINKPGSDNQFP